MHNEVLIIIPARGGSKGTPQKNIKMFAGHPLIAHSITAAHFTRYASKVIVSTDSYEIAEIAKLYGAEVPFLRPPELATDTSRDIEFCQHALSELEGNYEYIVILRPTSPIRPHGLVNKGILRLVDEPAADSLRVVTESSETPYKMWVMEAVLASESKWMLPAVDVNPNVIEEAYNAPRQELYKTYWQTGHLDVIRRRTIEDGSITGKYVMPLEIERKYVVDIDTPEDFQRAETVYKQFTAEEIVMPCHPSSVCHPRHAF